MKILGGWKRDFWDLVTGDSSGHSPPTDWMTAGSVLA